MTGPARGATVQIDYSGWRRSRRVVNKEISQSGDGGRSSRPFGGESISVECPFSVSIRIYVSDGQCCARQWEERKAATTPPGALSHHRRKFLAFGCRSAVLETHTAASRSDAAGSQPAVLHFPRACARLRLRLAAGDAPDGLTSRPTVVTEARSLQKLVTRSREADRKLIAVPIGL
jgi:hypothetical protein